jgi:hypothetical protein
MGFRLEYELAAKCRPEHIWQKFEKLEQWAWWNRVIAQSKWLHGQPWEKGSRFLLGLARPTAINIPVVILECSPPQKVGWVGRFWGVRGEHWFHFEPQVDGTTRMKTWEDFSGWGTLFLGNGRREGVRQSYKEWFEALKVEAERIAREEAARS